MSNHNNLLGLKDLEGLNIKETLKTASEVLNSISDSPFLDAEVLLCFVLHKERSYLRAWSDKKLSDEECTAFLRLLNQRLSGTPIAYITGRREFWSREFIVSPNVLIPRPDTELIIELALKFCEKDLNHPYKIIDLGTGSGIIAITLAKELPNALIIACDTSLDALKIAKQNALQLEAKNIEFCQSSWFDNIKEKDFDLIISNPPYISAEDPHLQQGDIRFEPQTALIAKDKGLNDIECILKAAKQRLNVLGKIFIEHGFQQQQAVQTLFKHYRYTNIETHLDLAGNPRVTSAQ